jgi:uncharacterized membrane protein
MHGRHLDIKTALFVAYLILLVFTSSVASAQQSNIEAADNSINDAYSAIVKAGAAGADTKQFIDQLNQAINLTSQAKKIAPSNPSQAETFCTIAQSIAQNITQQANLAQQSASTTIPLLAAGSAILSLTIGVAGYFLGSKFFWALWFKFKKNFRVNVKKSDGNNKAVVFTAEKLFAVFLGLTVLVAFFSVSAFLVPNSQGEKYSELGILGSNGLLGEYPTQIVASQTVHLFGYVGNQMGSAMYYTVMVKLGNSDTQLNPSYVTPIQQYNQVLSNNQTWIFPVDVTLTKVGGNQRIIFELWIYNETTHKNQYHQRWGQVWLNVTAPAN